MEDIIFLIVGAILGAIASWVITHIYYKKANSENEKQIEELKKYIKENISDKMLECEVVDEW